MDSENDLGAVLGILIGPDNRIPLVLDKRREATDAKWKFPGGHIERYDTKIDEKTRADAPAYAYVAMKREWQEETGLNDIKEMSCIWTPERHHGFQYIFLGILKSYRGMTRPGTFGSTHEIVRLFTLKEILSMERELLPWHKEVLRYFSNLGK